MISITILENSKKNYQGIILEGHAGYAKRGFKRKKETVTVRQKHTNDI